MLSLNKKLLGAGAAACLCLAALALFLLNKKPAPAAPPHSGGDSGSGLPARMAALPKPALANLPQAAPPPAEPPPATNAPAAPARLSEDTLAPLRRAFTPPRFTEDPAFPRERQTLLSNRRLVAPEARALPSAASGRQTPSPRGTTPFIVQFNTPVSDAARESLTAAGAVVRGFFPNNAVLAELTPAALAALGGLPQVQAADEFLPGDKLQPFLSSLIAAQPAGARVRVTIQTFAPEDAETAALAVREAGGDVEEAHAGTRWGTLRATLPLGAVRALAALGAVQWIEESPPAKPLNDQAALPAHLNATPAWDAWGLTGRGQVVGHADTGLDTGNLTTMHPDFQGRVRAVFARARPGDASDTHGHGTHTAGSILGSGAASGGLYRGTAWEAELVHQSVATASGDFIGLPADLYTLYLESYTNGAAIHSDSWGAESFGAYNSYCRDTDLFAWDHPEHLAVFAAGNSGTDANADGRVDSNSTITPATAKNALAVGASENDRPSGSGGYSSHRYGSIWSADFPAEPIKTDLVSYSATPSPVYRQGIAAFSSRGPTNDGRIKPDVVAPGTDVLSTKSSVGNVVWAAFSANPRYCFGGGTSMATPLAAGGAALVRQYCVERAGITNPSAALLKAMLVGGARSLAPGQYGTDDPATQEIPFTSPNIVEGWGQPDIAATVHPEGRMVRLFDRIAPAAGATNTFDVTVAADGAPLDVALCWMDYPATAGAGITRVNDFDLLVTAPDGTPLYPNGGTARDAINTVETVRVPTAAPGLYRVRVIGASVPYSGGVAALYVRGAVQAPPVIVHAPLPAQLAGAVPYPVPMRIQARAPLTNGEARVWWRTDGAAPWQAAPAAHVTNADYTASIPAQPAGATVDYTIEAACDGETAALPPGAPAEVFSFHVDQPAELTVGGLPDAIGSVTPPYGTHTQIANVPFAVSAPATVHEVPGVRYTCAGWTGTGDVPPTGATNAATLSIAQPSTLTWLWDTSYALTSRYCRADSGQTFGETVAWHPQGASASTEAAPELILSGAVPYAFCGWRVNGARWPDAASAAPNPAAGIVMNAPALAQGDYLPLWQDTDANGLSDWWELRHFGSATATPPLVADADADGDTWSNRSEALDNTDPNDPASVPAPPAIAFTPLPALQTGHPPWTVTADVTDNFTVEEVHLVWREEGDPAWRRTPMPRLPGTDTYAAALAPPRSGARRVDYFISAVDLVGYYLPEHAATTAVHSVTGDYPAPWLEVAPQTFDTFELSDAPGGLAFTVANLAGPDLVWTARVAAAAAPFAATDTAWAHGGPSDAWCVTDNRTWNGDPVWYCGDPATRTYPNACHATLDTPPFTVGAGGGLIFRQWLKTEHESGAHYWDGAVIRVSTDGGATFAPIAPVSGYPGLIVENPESPFPPDLPCLGGDGAGWETLLLDLADLAGQSVIVRFEFGADLYVVEEGWYLAGVAPFSFDEPAPWLLPAGPWGGTLPGAESTPCAATLAPAAIARDEEAAACIRLLSNAPSPAPLFPLTLRRGRFLTLSADGPGKAAADRTFLFRDDTATATLRADPGCYLYSVLIDGAPQPGVYDYTTVLKTFTFAHLPHDTALSAWFAPRLWNLTILSPEGVVFPVEGTYAHTNGTVVGAMAMSPLPLALPGVRLHCTGWTLTGHTPAAGPLNLVQFTITNDATLAWHWAPAFRLAADAGPNGTAAPAEGWYLAGASATVTAYPSAYYHFDAWSGDTAGASAQEGPVFTAVMDAPRAVAASFAPNLTAAHGVPEYWLAQYGWTGDFEAAAAADTDGDGMPAWAEWRADTDPTDPLSRLALTALAPEPPGGWRLVWTGGRDRTQEVQRADSPAGPWRPVHTNLPPTAATNAVTLPGGAASGFFRIAVP